MNNERSGHPLLPLLTATQLEDNAVIKYGPYAGAGYYWVPNSTGTAWIVNDARNPDGVGYVKDVRARAGQHPWP